MKTLHKFQVPKTTLSDIVKKADKYERMLYKYYLGEEPTGNYWKDELQKALRTNSKKTGRYVPGRSIKSLDKFDSNQILEEIKKHIINELNRNPSNLINTAFKSLDNLELRVNEFNKIEGINTLKNLIDTRIMGDKILTDDQVNGLKLELKKTFERYLGLKDGEVIVNTDNFQSGSPIFDIKVYNDRDALYTEVKRNLNNFRILGINSPFKTAPYFAEEMAKNCVVDIQRKRIILSAQSIEDVSVKLLQEHFDEYQPVFESDEYVKLFTSLFVGNEMVLPIVAKDEENEDPKGELIVKPQETEMERNKKVENYITQKISRYML